MIVEKGRSRAGARSLREVRENRRPDCPDSAYRPSLVHLLAQESGYIQIVGCERLDLPLFYYDLLPA